MDSCNRRSRDYVKLDFEKSDISFATKGYYPLPHRHKRNLTPQQLKNDVLQSIRLQEMMVKVAEERGMEFAEIEKEVKSLLDEIGHKFFLPAVRTIAFVLRGPIRQVVRAINIKFEGLEQIRQAVQQWPVLLLPSHRSYLDFILITYFLFEMDIQAPCIAAGQDFMNMKLVSSLLRRSGAFFLRRTFGSDQLYKLIFTLYTQHLLCSNMAPVEFFIEGTRSRTAKSLHPKLGMLSMMVEPYLQGYLPDLLMFPISISYERTLEEDLFSWELLGQPKPKESTTGLMRALSLLKEDYGSIYVNIANPLSLHDFCQQQGISRIPHGLAPRHEIVLSQKEWDMIKSLGYTLVDLLDKNVVIFPSSLLASLLLYHHYNYNDTNKDDLVRQMEWLRNEIRVRGGVVDWPSDSHTVVTSCLHLLSSCVEKMDGEKVRVPRCLSKHHTPGSGSSFDIMEEVIFKGALHLKLGHYRNKLLHLFVPEAMVLMTVKQGLDVTREQALRQFCFLYTALSKEFVFSHSCCDKEKQFLFDRTLRQLVDRGVVHLEDMTLSVNEQKLQMADYLANLVRPFVAGVWILCHQLLSLQGGVQTLKRTCTEAQRIAAKLIYSGDLRTFEPLSSDILKNAMSSLDEDGLIMNLEHEFEGRDRLVKVAQTQRLQELTKQLGAVLYPSGHEIKVTSFPTILPAKL